MPPPNPRALALRVLQRWDTGQAHLHAEQIVEQVAPRATIDPRDRAQINALVLGTLRNRSLLDHWLAHLLDRRPPDKLPPHLHRLLQLALFDLLILGAAPHAATNQAVALAPKRLRGLANALLRRAGRERDQLDQLATAAPLHIRFSHPEFLVGRWLDRFGPEATTSLLAWNNTPAPVVLRPNRLHPEPFSPPADTTDPLGFTAVDPLDPDLLTSGRAYAHDPSTALAPLLLDPKPDAAFSVLDTCAAPGGKTALLAQLMQNRGRIVATDHATDRLATLRENLVRLHVTNTSILTHDWSTSPHPDLGGFDAILVDTPCSNTGVLRRRVDARWRLTPDTITTSLPTLQLAITQNAAHHLNPGGHLVYSTCSIEPEENEQLVATLLATTPHLKHLESRQTLPQSDHVDGAFAALFTRT